jgi:iron complex transport system substrate-binding protein
MNVVRTPPQRIVSLLPSATEILFAVGAGDNVVGVTFECDFPDQARTRQIVSNTALPPNLTPSEIDREVRLRIAAGDDLYTLDEGALREIDPDLVVTQDLCAVCAVDVSEVDQALDHLGCSSDVLTLDPMTLAEVFASIVQVGDATGQRDEGRQLVGELEARLGEIEAAVTGQPRPAMAFLEWTEPPFSAGHWVPDMVDAAGARCLLGRGGGRSETITWEQLAESAPDVIVVSPCGFRLDGASQLAEDLVKSHVLPQGTPVWAVDADASFVRPGPRLIDGVNVLAHIAHPEVVALRDGEAVLVRSA